jgi:glycosyltransferase involved in cell wall biosynthesis
MYSGNLGLGHELETAIQAVARIENRSALRVRFVGNGKLRESLEKQVGELGLECVEFMPPCSLAHLSDSLAAADIHLVSQRPGTEGLLVPSKIYGVLAAGRPVLYIGSTETEVARIIQDADAGRLTPSGDATAVAKALQELLDDVNLRTAMGERAKEYYASHFGRDRSSGRIADLVESVSCSKGGSSR